MKNLFKRSFLTSIVLGLFAFVVFANPVYAGTGSITASTSNCTMPCSGVTITWMSQLGGGNVHVEQNGTTISSATSNSNFPVTISLGSNVFNLFVAGSNDDDSGNTMRFTVTGTNAPTISEVKTDANDNSVTINWTSNPAGDTVVDYGLTTSYELGTKNISESKTVHEVIISGLTNNKTYQFRVKTTANGATGQSTGSFATQTRNSSSGTSSPTNTPAPQAAATSAPTPTKAPTQTGSVLGSQVTPTEEPTPTEEITPVPTEEVTPAPTGEVLGAKTADQGSMISKLFVDFANNPVAKILVGLAVLVGGAGAIVMMDPNLPIIEKIKSLFFKKPL